MKTITDWADIPVLDSEEDEAEFWASHQIDPRLMSESVHRAGGRDSTTITLRFDPRMLNRIKRIANSRYLNYQSMIKQWLSERLEQEQRDRESRDR